MGTDIRLVAEAMIASLSASHRRSMQNTRRRLAALANLRLVNRGQWLWLGLLSP